MKIDRIRVTGLFNDFDHDLAFASGERIMLVIGPNGFGKTTILKLIDVLFNEPLSRLSSIPFREVDVAFDDGTQLVVRRDSASHGQTGDRVPLTLIRKLGDSTDTFQPPRVPFAQDSRRIPASAIEDIIPELKRVDYDKWLNLETGYTFDFDDIRTTYWESLRLQPRPALLQGPDWLQDMRRSVTVRLIDTERLTHVLRPGRHNRAIKTTRTVSHYSQELSRRIKDSIAKYGAKSQLLDRTFPNRLVTDQMHSSRAVKALREDLDAIDRMRMKLEDVGLIAGNQHGLDIPDLSRVDESQRGVLAVYAHDAMQKLAVFDELYNKVSTFKRIANCRFRHKQVAVNAEGLSVTKIDGTALDLEKLSSGEQHELVMLYELLFKASSNSLVLIDEPELSLHITWQEKWVQDLEEAACVTEFRAIVATHSPEIIGDRWDLTVELRGRNED